MCDTSSTSRWRILLLQDQSVRQTRLFLSSYVWESVQVSNGRRGCFCHPEGLFGRAFRHQMVRSKSENTFGMLSVWISSSPIELLWGKMVNL